MPNLTPNRSHLTQGYTTALVSALFLSTTAIFIRHLSVAYQLPALVLAVWREVFVSLTLLVIFLLVRPRLLKVQRLHLPYLLAYGFLLAVFNSFWTLSVALNGAAVSTVLVYCSAGFTALLGWWLLKESLGPAKLLAVVLSLGGCVLVAGAYTPEVWNTNLAGILTGILAGLMYAIYSLMGRSASQRGLNPWSTLFYTFTIAAGFLGVFNVLTAVLPGWNIVPGAAARLSDFLWLGNAWGGWAVLFVLAAVPTLAGYGLYNVSLSHLPSSVANLILTTEPAFTAVIAYFAFGEVLTGIQIVGSILILGGVVFLRIFEGRQTSKKELYAQNESAKKIKMELQD